MDNLVLGAALKLYCTIKHNSRSEYYKIIEDPLYSYGPD